MIILMHTGEDKRSLYDIIGGISPASSRRQITDRIQEAKAYSETALQFTYQEWQKVDLEYKKIQKCRAALGTVTDRASYDEKLAGKPPSETERRNLQCHLQEVLGGQGVSQGNMLSENEIKHFLSFLRQIDGRTFYEIIEVRPDASQEEIENALEYAECSMEEKREFAQSIYDSMLKEDKKLKHACRIIGNPMRKMQYDAACMNVSGITLIVSRNAGNGREADNPPLA